MMLQKPLISIITVVYNGEKYLEETIQSVINQTYDNVEYIIIDGGSTDGTLDIIRKYEDQIDYWVSESDKGIYDAMNKGLNAVSGDYVNFMNGGDCFYDAHVLENITKILLSSPRDFIFGDSIDMPENHTGAGHYKKSWPILFKYYGMFTHHQSMFYKAAIIQSHTITYDLNYKIAADYDFTFHFLKYSKSVIYSPQPIAKFQLGGISETSFILGKKEQIQIRKSRTKIPYVINKGIFYLQISAYIFKTKFRTFYNAMRYSK